MSTPCVHCHDKRGCVHQHWKACTGWADRRNDIHTMAIVTERGKAVGVIWSSHCNAGQMMAINNRASNTNVKEDRKAISHAVDTGWRLVACVESVVSSRHCKDHSLWSIRWESPLEDNPFFDSWKKHTSSTAAVTASFIETLVEVPRDMLKRCRISRKEIFKAVLEKGWSSIINSLSHRLLARLVLWGYPLDPFDNTTTIQNNVHLFRQLCMQD